MQVKLVSYSQTPSQISDNNKEEKKEENDIQPKNLQELVAFCARVSNPTNQNNSKTSRKLIRYLIKHQHWSPLEMVSVCIEIETTRDIARQILRHRSFSFQEFSQRYADPVNELSFESREPRLQDTKNRQNSIDMDLSEEKNKHIAIEWYRKQKELIEKASEYYIWALRNGIAKEQARALLPEGLTKTRMYVHGTMRSWIHYIQLRSANGTQKEHQEIAIECARVIGSIFPFIQSSAITQQT